MEIVVAGILKYPLAFKQVINSGDANELQSTGVWGVQGTTANMPEYAGLCVVFASEGVYPKCAQIFLTHIGKVFSRVMDGNSSWTEWKEL